MGNSIVETKEPAMDLSRVTWKKEGPKYWETRKRSPDKNDYNTEDLLLNVTIDTS